VVFVEKLEGFVGWRASLVDKVVDPLLSGHQLFVPSSQRRLTVTQFGAQQTPNAETSAGRFRACRRVLLLIYATTVVYFFYAPWNYLLLAALLLRPHRGGRTGNQFWRAPGAI
jgi:hypothetical protein